MDTRIVSNNLIYFFIILIGTSISFNSCSRHSSLSHVAKKQIEDNFKLLFLCRCIEFGHNSSIDVKKILKDDLCYSGDLQSIERRKTIDSLARLIQISIKMDSIKISKIDAPDYIKNKKRVIQICADYYSGEILDSIARIK